MLNALIHVVIKVTFLICCGAWIRFKRFSSWCIWIVQRNTNITLTLSKKIARRNVKICAITIRMIFTADLYKAFICIFWNMPSSRHESLFVFSTLVLYTGLCHLLHSMLICSYDMWLFFKACQPPEIMTLARNCDTIQQIGCVVCWLEAWGTPLKQSRFPAFSLFHDKTSAQEKICIFWLAFTLRTHTHFPFSIHAFSLFFFLCLLSFLHI